MKKVATKWIIAVSPDAEIKVRHGQRIGKGEVVALEPVVNERVIRIEETARMPEKDFAKFYDLILNKNIAEGEVIFETGGWFKQKIKSPAGGKVVKIDEFRNIYFQSSGEGRREIFSPTDSTVDEVKDGKITLRFEAEEYNGDGLNDGREWADGGLKPVSKILDLSYADKDKIILLKTMTPAILVKAEVVGAKGIVIPDSDPSGQDDRINFKLPILEVAEDDWELLLHKADKGQRAMINATAGRLLLVI